MPTEEVFETICNWLAKLNKKKATYSSKSETSPTQNLNNTKNIKTYTTSPINEDTIKDEANIKEAWLKAVKEEQKKAGLGHSYGYENFDVPLHTYKRVLDYSKFREKLIEQFKEKQTSETQDINTLETKNNPKDIEHEH